MDSSFLNLELEGLHTKEDCIILMDAEEYVGYVPYINGKLQHYECFCGNSGDFPTYINKGRFVCPKCGNNHFIMTNSKTGFAVDSITMEIILSNYKNRYDFYKKQNIMVKKPLALSCEAVNNSIVFLSEDDEVYNFKCRVYQVKYTEDLCTVLKETYKLYKVSKDDFSFRDMKGKEKPKIVTLREQSDTYREIERLIISKLEYKLEGYTGLDYYSMDNHAVRLKFLSSPSVYQLFKNNLISTVVNKGVISMNVNMQGTNIPDILRLPKSICNIILTDEFDDGYSKHGYAEVLLLNAYKLHKNFGNVNKQIALNTDELRNLFNGVLEITRRWHRVLNAEWELNKQAEQEYVDSTQNVVPAYNRYNYYNNPICLSHYELDTLIGSVSKLVSYDYNLDRLIDYVTSCYEKQGIYLIEFMTLLEDYARMCKHMGLKYEKYPISIKLHHDLIVKKYKLVKNKVKDSELKEIADRYSSYETSVKGYTFTLPRRCLDFIKESNALGHCVSSYTEKVFNGECVIVFMRESKNVSKPFVTIEVSDGAVKQVKGFSDKKPTAEVMGVVKEWCKKLNLVFVSY